MRVYSPTIMMLARDEDKMGVDCWNRRLRLHKIKRKRGEGSR